MNSLFMHVVTEEISLRCNQSGHRKLPALAKGVFNLYPHKCKVIDIGEQDTKFIDIRENGTVESFRINRKCAAGTCSFLEEIAYRLDVPSEEFSSIARNADEELRLTSFCAVFAISEIIGMVKNRVSLPNIILSVYASVMERCMELGDLSGRIVLTGGIPKYHPLLVELFRKKHDSVELTDHPQFLAAYGATL